MTHGRQLPYGINETDSNGDVPSPKTNIPQNGSEVYTEKQTQFDSAADEANQNAVYGRFFSFSLLLLLLFTILYGKINYL